MSGGSQATEPPDPRLLVPPLLAWYDGHRRRLPWRAPPGHRPDPYHVWLSEIMLQQTTVVAVAPYFRDFLARWPTVADLAAAPLEDVLQAWAGLGYYARARNLHACARTLAAAHGGRFPETEAALRQLPGIGAYTAAAIAAIAFDRPTVAVDGNVERVMARLHAVETPLPGAKPALKRLAEALVSPERPGDVTQALMDLGATVCTPRKPKCLLCPWSAACHAYRLGRAQALPARSPKAERPTRRGIAFFATDPAGAVLLRQRPPEGLLGAMMEVPSSPWLEGAGMPSLDAVISQAPLAASWRLLPGRVTHTFTHFHLELGVAVARCQQVPEPFPGIWVPVDRLGDQALPTVMRKIVRHALAHAGTGGAA